MITSKYDSCGIGTRLNINVDDKTPIKLFFVGFRGIYEGVFWGMGEKKTFMGDLNQIYRVPDVLI